MVSAILCLPNKIKSSEIYSDKAELDLIVHICDDSGEVKSIQFFTCLLAKFILVVFKSPFLYFVSVACALREPHLFTVFSSTA